MYTLICNWPSPATWNVEPQKREPPQSIVLSETSLTATDEEEDAGDGGAGDVMLRDVPHQSQLAVVFRYIGGHEKRRVHLRNFGCSSHPGGLLPT